MNLSTDFTPTAGFSYNSLDDSFFGASVWPDEMVRVH